MPKLTNPDLHDLPLYLRREVLEFLYKKYLKNNNFALTNFDVVQNEAELTKSFNRLSKLPQSEGVLIKALSSIWDTDGSIEGWAKIKIEVEIKVMVLERLPTKIKGTYNYLYGLAVGESDYKSDWEIDKSGKPVRIKVKEI